MVLIACACNSSDNDKYPKAENAFDAGREFIDGCLKGDFSNKTRVRPKNKPARAEVPRSINYC